MQCWMISANGKIYDHAAAFEKWGYIDWRQHARYSVGDIVYIYCTRPYQRVMYKTMVLKESMDITDIVDDREFWYVADEYEKAITGKYARLQLLEQADHEKLSLENLKMHGLKSAPQGPLKVKPELETYINLYLKDDYSEGFFPESDLPGASYEGAVCQVPVNKYERSSIARKKCIEFHGLNCGICGMSFMEVYGDIGADFIHVHHIVPLNQIGREYRVDYKKDLIPVCPNCHAMLHRTVDGRNISIEELRKIVRKNRSK